MVDGLTLSEHTLAVSVQPCLETGQSHLVRSTGGWGKPGQEPSEVGIVEGCAEALAGDAAAGRVILPNQVEGELAQDGESMRPLADPDRTGVFAELDIEHPVQPILEAPVDS